MAGLPRRARHLLPCPGATHGHGHGGTRAHGEEQRVGGVGKLGAIGSLHLRHRCQDLLPTSVGQAAAGLVKVLQGVQEGCACRARGFGVGGQARQRSVEVPLLELY